ncbi:DUF6768 family protein [Hyphococcus sp.]|uniref:DUF6768 family protein n=1 Tax=Hyphococcus sp. TaxID=2038636 RepID=UPI003CCBBEAA
MDDLDKQIEDVLNEEDRALLKQFPEQGLMGQIKSVFQGRMAWVSVMSLIVGTILNIAFFYAAWKFFTITDINAKLLWGGGAWFLATMVAFMKVWFWMRMESNRVLRELKRLELQIARAVKSD